MNSVRVLLLLGGTALWLGGCAVGGFDLGGTTAQPTSAAEPAVTAPQAVPQPAAQSAAAEPSPAVATAPVRSTSSRQLPAGRATRTPPTPPPEEAADEGPMTTTRAREICWMATEENAKIKRDMDAKIKFVEKCVSDKMRSAGQ
jgi:hypothetical protein